MGKYAPTTVAMRWTYECGGAAPAGPGRLGGVGHLHDRGRRAGHDPADAVTHAHTAGGAHRRATGRTHHPGDDVHAGWPTPCPVRGRASRRTRHRPGAAARGHRRAPAAGLGLGRTGPAHRPAAPGMEAGQPRRGRAHPAQRPDPGHPTRSHRCRAPAQDFLVIGPPARPDHDDPVHRKTGRCRRGARSSGYSEHGDAARTGARPGRRLCDGADCDRPAVGPHRPQSPHHHRGQHR